jgi:hypothetical protein
LLRQARLFQAFNLQIVINGSHPCRALSHEVVKVLRPYFNGLSQRLVSFLDSAEVAERRCLEAISIRLIWAEADKAIRGFDCGLEVARIEVRCAHPKLIGVLRNKNRTRLGQCFHTGVDVDSVAIGLPNWDYRRGF